MLRLLLEDMDKTNSIDCYHVVEKDIPRKTVLSVRRSLPSYHHVKDFWSDFFSMIRRRKITPKPPLFVRSLCLDKEYREADVDVELQIEVAADTAGDETYRIITTPSVHAAAVTFDGGDRKNGHAVRRALARWLEVNGCGLDGTIFNTPHLSNLDESNPEQWINEWGFELMKKKDDSGKTEKIS
jgi:effector-binding domain-containing protein